MFEWFSMKILKFFPTRIYELKGDLSPVMLKKIFHNSFEHFEIYQDLYGKPCKRDWVAKVIFLIQMLLTFDGRCNRYS